MFWYDWLENDFAMKKGDRDQRRDRAQPGNPLLAPKVRSHVMTAGGSSVLLSLVAFSTAYPMRNESDIRAEELEAILAKDVISESELTRAKGRAWERMEHLSDRFLDYSLGGPLQASIGYLQEVREASGELIEILAELAEKTVVPASSTAVIVPTAACSAESDFQAQPESSVVEEPEVELVELGLIGPSNVPDESAQL